MGQKRKVEHLKPGEKREVKGNAVMYPWQYKNNLMRLQKKDGIEYGIEIVKEGKKVYFKRAS